MFNIKKVVCRIYDPPATDVKDLGVETVIPDHAGAKMIRDTLMRRPGAQAQPFDYEGHLVSAIVAPDAAARESPTSSTPTDSDCRLRRDSP